MKCEEGSCRKMEQSENDGQSRNEIGDEGRLDEGDVKRTIKESESSCRFVVRGSWRGRKRGAGGALVKGDIWQ